MKLIIGTILIMSLIWQGCHTYFSVKEDEGKNLDNLEDRDLKIKLDDGAVIESPEYLHTYISKPSDLLLGEGREQKYWSTDESKSFTGKIFIKEIDSLAVYSTSKNKLIKCYLKNGSVLVFEEGNYLRIKPQDGTGLWLKGEKIRGESQNNFAGRLNLNSAENIEVKKFDGVATIALIAAVTGVLIAIAYQSNPWLRK